LIDLATANTPKANNQPTNEPTYKHIYMKTIDATVGNITTLEQATKTAIEWYNPKLGYHTQVVSKGAGYICRLVVNG